VKLRMILACAAAVALTVGVTTATAGNGNGGNSDAAKRCQKGGWKTLVRSEDGSSFANQGDCVSYGARGGTLTPDRFSDSRALCASVGGAFAVGVGISGYEGFPYWSCTKTGYFLSPAYGPFIDACSHTVGHVDYLSDLFPDTFVCLLTPAI
jgi:hypothetical protein